MHVVGTAFTNAQGVATLQNVDLRYSAGGPWIGTGAYATGVYVSFAGDANFGAAPATNSLAVNKAHLDITADDQTKIYGDSLPALTFTGAWLQSPC